MSVSDEEVRAIARLARLAIDESDIPAYADQLSKILDFVAQMDSADTDSVEPLYHPLDLPARLRPDVVTESDERQTLQAVAPQTADDMYLVPLVIE